ncbi:hypothetical protein WR25_19254 [Diploscapter pachys]|uniref:PDZ domain-containing protein n=1 Tax=Diploscapter pachys TaxID=2018661 RepID=A0A2A2L7L4_9BILA|nr:hypothetical protein WR25_19254 [Diploscapter pachys]
MEERLPLFLFLLGLINGVSAADTCLSQPQLFGVIFGSVAATVVISAGIGILLWILLRKDDHVKTSDKSAYTNEAYDVEDKAVDAKKISQRDKMTMIESFKLRKKHADAGTQKAFSTEHLNEVDAKIGVQLNPDDIGGLGFNIKGNVAEGIFVKNVMPKSPAEESGNIITGDRIKSLTINFENMVYEDAVTLLSYASPYKVKLELERRLDEPTSDGKLEEEKYARLHPLLRSNTLSHIHYNPIAGGEPIRCQSVETTQKHSLPKIKGMKLKLNVSYQASSILDQNDSKAAADSTTAENDVSKLESSDYASDNTSAASSFRDSEKTGTGSPMPLSANHSQHTVSDRIEVSDLIVDENIVSPSPTNKPLLCKELPPKPQKIVSRSPSPKMCRKSPSPTVTYRSPSPLKRTPTPPITEEPEFEQTQLADDIYGEVPAPPPVSSIPLRKESPPQIKSRIPSPPKAPPEITEAKISRIPRKDSSKTPIVERKLPKLPRPIAQRSQSADDKNDDVWSRLYLEKKGQLKKTRDVGMSPPGQVNSPSPVPSPSPQMGRATSSQNPNEDRYGTLNRERRERLAANDAQLQKQREELRKLGILD